MFWRNNICNSEFLLLLLHLEDISQARRKDPAKVCDATELQSNAGVVRRLHDHQLHELDGVEGGDNLGHQLGDNDHNHTGQQSSLQEHSLDPVRNMEQESSLCFAMNCGQLSSKEHQAHYKHLDIILMKNILKKYFEF